MYRQRLDTIAPLIVLCVFSLVLTGLFLPSGPVVAEQTEHKDAEPAAEVLSVEDTTSESIQESLPHETPPPSSDANRIEPLMNPNQSEEGSRTIIPQRPKPLGYYEYRFDKSFGGYGLGNGYFERPVDVAVDMDDNIYVCDMEGGRIQTFDSEGNFDEEWVRLSLDLASFKESNTMDEPQAIYVDYKDRARVTFIYVADTKNNRILQFNKDGTLIGPDGEEIDNTTEWITIRKDLLWGEFGSGERQFHHPADIAVDKNDNCYILDSRNHRIQCFDDEGIFKFEFGGFGSGPGSFLKPTRIAYDPSRFGAIWVIDSKNGKFHKFDLDGTFVKAYQPMDDHGAPLPSPADLYLDTQGFLYVTDSSLNRVFKYNNDVEFIQCWGEEGSGPGQFKKPMGIAVDSEDRVLVVDSGNYRVQIFRQF